MAVDGQDYPLMKGTAFEDSRKVDALLDAHGELRIKDHLRMQEPLSLRGAAEQKYLVKKPVQRITSQ